MDESNFLLVCGQGGRESDCCPNVNFGTGSIPKVLDGMRLGRLTAVKETRRGSKGGIVVGDVMRRLVARTMAKQFAKKVKEATVPFLQYVLTTKAGCECVAHILHTITNLAIDGVGAYDASYGALTESP